MEYLTTLYIPRRNLRSSHFPKQTCDSLDPNLNNDAHRHKLSTHVGVAGVPTARAIGIVNSSARAFILTRFVGATSSTCTTLLQAAETPQEHTKLVIFVFSHEPHRVTIRRTEGYQVNSLLVAQVRLPASFSLRKK